MRGIFGYEMSRGWMIGLEIIRLGWIWTLYFIREIVGFETIFRGMFWY